MRNVARIGDELVVYNNSTKEIVGVLANEKWTPAGDNPEYEYSDEDLKEAKDLTLEEVKKYVDKRFKAEHSDKAAVNDEDIDVSIDESGNLVVVFPNNFVSYGDGDTDLMPPTGYNVTAHLNYAYLFKDIDTPVEGNYSFKIKSYDAKGVINKVLEALGTP